MAKTHTYKLYQRLVHSPLFAGFFAMLIGGLPLWFTAQSIVGSLVEYERSIPGIVRSTARPRLTTEELLQLVAQRRAERVLTMPQTALIKKGVTEQIIKEEVINTEEVVVHALSSQSAASSQSSVLSSLTEHSRASALIPGSSSEGQYSSVVPVQITPQPEVVSSVPTVEVTLPLSSLSSVELQMLRPAATDEVSFPAFGRAVHPVQQIPNWGAMNNETEWNRAYGAIPQSEYVPVPTYTISQLTTPMSALLLNRARNEAIITAKLYYSTRYFGRYHLDSGEHEWMHAGIDLKLPLGTPFGTIAGGQVFAVRTDNTLGTHVIVEHRLNDTVYYSIYGHMESVSVQVGDALLPGQLIGTVGNSGSSSAPHIHLQINKSDPDWRSSGVLTKAKAAQYTVHPIEFIATY